ncbi:putative rhabdoid tumor deletion region protein 1 [Scophthalmus maximus]|uniref:Putative rhabdoid tumor deletion region protein 1 n=1 Tax=Scophthalmus maximus TaxID=52904 RepID=A0A2U9BU00_SCOMX|nr:putative rhabdoid tumor deletion region protein 1 [Scophthalmus maximus]
MIFMNSNVSAVKNIQYILACLMHKREDEGVTEREHRVQVQRFFREISSQTEKQEFQELHVGYHGNKRTRVKPEVTATTAKIQSRQNPSRTSELMSRDLGAAPGPRRAPVAFGRWAVPRLFDELQRPDSSSRHEALESLCDLMRDPERLYQTVNGGFLEQLKVLLADDDASVRRETVELLHLLCGHSVGRQALLASSLLPPLAQLLDDSSSSCRTNVQRVLNRLALLPAGADALLALVPKLMLKLEEEEEEEEEVQVLLLSTLSRCSRLNALPALASDGVSLVGRKLSHRCTSVRREAAAAMMALSVPEDGKRQVCEEAVLPVVVALLQDDDVEVQANAAGVVMYTVVITAGSRRSGLFRGRVLAASGPLRLLRSHVPELQVVLFLLSAVFFSCPVPERFAPGRFDIVGHGHQLSHILLSLCTLAQQEALLEDFLWRRPALVREFGEERLLLACASFFGLALCCAATALAMRVGACDLMDAWDYLLKSPQLKKLLLLNVS